MSTNDRPFQGIMSMEMELDFRKGSIKKSPKTSMSLLKQAALVGDALLLFMRFNVIVLWLFVVRCLRLFHSSLKSINLLRGNQHMERNIVIIGGDCFRQWLKKG
jgi:hypothetical protein